MSRRGRGTPAGLSRERIATAAVALVDRDGLETFGVRRLAAELGVDPMSIYNHIPGKAALLDAISEAVLTEASAQVDPWPQDWRDVARALARTYREMATRHPRVFPLLTTRAQTSATALEAVEQLTALMRRANLPDQVTADAPLVLFGFLNGYLLATLGTSARDSQGESAGSTQLELDPLAYPTLAALGPLQTGFGGDEEFERMLDTILTGIASRAPRPS
ncbi:TetR/AcrR family transcriptional regulator [Intrasporangium calvum]|uniref:TetR/AcrR family transcriptional regulator n=1 Tax=Intrasporangium calvum TaxID=53358 RepID=A0ABT5GG06_9MICO|nr:TetR/AcrR family transcriptional regulator [Intrasporangium calvum]MDC5697198.1 TetR/AcrR family transcriptional regulator [Intrasporangium calvum]